VKVGVEDLAGSILLRYVNWAAVFRDKGCVVTRPWMMSKECDGQPFQHDLKDRTEVKPPQLFLLGRS
jgi:hypothetical protein